VTCVTKRDNGFFRQIESFAHNSVSSVINVLEQNVQTRIIHHAYYSELCR
jgi:hypothetical protein